MGSVVFVIYSTRNGVDDGDKTFDDIIDNSNTDADTQW